MAQSRHPQETPHSMAQSARDKLQTSASQFWSSIRSLEENMKKPVVSPESPAEERSGGNTSLESVIRVMFGACTGVSPDAQSTSKRDATSETSSRSLEKSKSTCEPISPNPSQEDAMYTQLFRNEHFRAEEAVSHLREQMEMRKEVRDPQRQSPPHSKGTKTLHKIFPASSPGSPRKEREITVEKSPPKKQTKREPHVPQNMSFDDGISAISAHTLDDMARMYEVDETLLNRVHSDVTQDHVDTSVENWHGTAQRSGAKMSPLRWARTGRSQGTINTKHSRGTRSFATKSTLSTQTTEFASAFRKNEQNYWQDVVDEQGDPASMKKDVMNNETIMKARRMRRKKDADLKSRKGSTIATDRSSFYSSMESNSDRRNPSGIVVNSRATGRIFNDHDLMMEVLVMPPGTELGEI